MKFANKSEVLYKKSTRAKMGENKGKKTIMTYEIGFARERDRNGKIRNRGILFCNTKFSSGKKTHSLLHDSITASTKKEVIAKAKRYLKKYHFV